MHSKQKGNIGEIAVAADLAKKNIPVFTELGDLAKVDLIALVDDVPIKIQVKARSLKNGVIHIKSSKAGPDYEYRYKVTDVDIFALYCLDTEDVGYVLAKDLLKLNTTTFRINSPINNQKKKIRMLKDYQDFKGILRDYTPNTLTSNVEGDDIVQTTTE